MTQTELGERVGRGRTTIIRWEADPLSITGEHLCELAKVFNCSIDYLLGITDERTPKMSAS